MSKKTDAELDHQLETERTSLETVQDTYRESLQAARDDLIRLETELCGIPSDVEIKAMSQRRQCIQARMGIATQIYELDRVRPITEQVDRLTKASKSGKRTRRSGRVAAPIIPSSQLN